MEFSNWQIEELKALAHVYIKHRQPHKAQALRSELGRRLEQNHDEHVRILVDQLECGTVLSLTDRIFQRLKKLA